MDIIYNNYWEMMMEKNKEIDKLRTYKVVVDYLRDELMTSNLPIESVNYVLGILNYVEDGECIRTSFYPEELVNNKLRRILEIL